MYGVFREPKNRLPNNGQPTLPSPNDLHSHFLDSEAILATLNFTLKHRTWRRNTVSVLVAWLGLGCPKWPRKREDWSGKCLQHFYHRVCGSILTLTLTWYLAYITTHKLNLSHEAVWFTESMSLPSSWSGIRCSIMGFSTSTESPCTYHSSETSFEWSSLIFWSQHVKRISMSRTDGGFCWVLCDFRVSGWGNVTQPRFRDVGCLKWPVPLTINV